MNAERLMLLGGVASFALTIYWVRTRDLREKFALAWITAAVLLLLCGLFPHAIMSVADASHLSYPAAVLFIALAALYFFSLIVSVSLTHQYRRNVRLLQELAMLEQRVRLLERDRREFADPAPEPSAEAADGWAGGRRVPAG